MWYTRSEAQRRYTFFFSSTSLAGAFGGLLASAIGNSKSCAPRPPARRVLTADIAPVDGLRGFRGWRWIFIIEGSLSVVVCLVFLFTFPSL